MKRRVYGLFPIVVACIVVITTSQHEHAVREHSLRGSNQMQHSDTDRNLQGE